MTRTLKSLPSEVVSAAFLAACLDELSALKPGNVHIHSDGHDMTVADFETAASAVAPFISALDIRVGLRIKSAVNASFQATGCNTNLGIILLAAPLSGAALTPHVSPDLRSRLALTLSDLDEADTEHAFSAIAQANPGGLGNSEQHDVHAIPDVTLLEAMKAATGRDRIAKAYFDAFEDIFSFGFPTFSSALKKDPTHLLAITTLHMAYLAQFPDTHIARKFGAATAIDVQRQAQKLSHYWQPPVTKEKFAALLKFDAKLKADGLNPGTTADFVVATLFAHKLQDNLAKNRCA